MEVPKEQQHREVTVPVPSPYTCPLTGAVAVVGEDGEGHLEKPSRTPAGALLKHTHTKALTARAAGRELTFTHNLGFNSKNIYICIVNTG